VVKTKLSPSEAEEIMQFYYRLTGEKIKNIPKLLQVHKTLQDYIKDKIKIHA